MRDQEDIRYHSKPLQVGIYAWDARGVVRPRRKNVHNIVTECKKAVIMNIVTTAGYTKGCGELTTADTCPRHADITRNINRRKMALL